MTGSDGSADTGNDTIRGGGGGEASEWAANHLAQAVESGPWGKGNPCRSGKADCMGILGRAWRANAEVFMSKRRSRKRGSFERNQSFIGTETKIDRKQLIAGNSHRDKKKKVQQ